MPADHTMEFPYTQHQQRHFNWARTHLQQTRCHQESVLFTDESRFSLHTADDREQVSCCHAACGARPLTHCGGGSVIVWGGFSYHHRPGLLVITGDLMGFWRHIDEVLTDVAESFL